MKVIADREKCIASGACVIANPEVFSQDDDGVVVLLDAEPGQELLAKTEEAAGACPAMAILLKS